MKIFSLFIISAIALSSCSETIRTVFDQQKDFSQYKTYCWMDGCEFKFAGPGYIKDPDLHSKIEKAIVEELKSKGLVKDDNNPDLIIGVTVAFQDETAIVYHRSEQNPYFAPVEGEREEIKYLKGSLVIGMADKKDSKMVWESLASRYMELNPDLSEENIRKGIKRILRDYPPKRK